MGVALRNDKVFIFFFFLLFGVYERFLLYLDLVSYVPLCPAKVRRPLLVVVDLSWVMLTFSFPLPFFLRPSECLFDPLAGFFFFSLEEGFFPVSFLVSPRRFSPRSLDTIFSSRMPFSSSMSLLTPPPSRGDFSARVTAVPP